MKTSYFAKVKGMYGLNLVSVAGKTPEGFRGTIYSKLAPKYEWWSVWKKENKGEEWYRERYFTTVLNTLNPYEIYNRLGDDAILCCYEKSGDFCHRHLIAEWLRKAGYSVEEL